MPRDKVSALARIMVLIAVGILAAAPLWVGSYGRYLLSMWMILGLSATGLNIPMGLASIYLFGHGGFMLVGAYVTAVAAAHFGIVFPFTLVLSVAVASLISFFIALPSLRLGGFSLGIVTFAFAAMLFQFVKAFDFFGGPQGIYMPHEAFVSLWGGWALYYVTLALFVMGVFAATSLASGRTGRALRSLGHNEIVAASTGVNVARLKITAIVISGAYGAAAGSLLSVTTAYVAPESFSPDLSISIFAAVIIGGLGTVSGPLVGSSFVALLPELAQSVQQYGVVAYSAAFLLVATFFPNGIVGVFAGAFDWVSRRVQSARKA